LKAESKGVRPNERAKIILVGNGRVGKTSMSRRLKGLHFREDEKLTHGIHLDDLDKTHLREVSTEGLQAVLWDFGGQEIFYATHQFFLSEDALYVLCWADAEITQQYKDRDRDELPEQGKDKPLDYWLDTIQRRGGKDAPVLIVQTHCDPPREWKSLCPPQADCLEFGAKTDYNLGILKTRIAQKINKIPHFGRDMAISYDQLIQELEQMRDNKITLEHFKTKICPKAGIDAGEEEEALKYLHRIGVAIWFRELEALRQTVFVKPNWLVDQVYRLINKELGHKKGRIDHDYLRQVFGDYTEAERGQLLELLKEFKLVFETQDKGKTLHIAPQYLREKPIEEQQEAMAFFADALQTAFVFAFPKYMPDNVMVNFLCTYGPYSKNMYWKNGICFQTQWGQNCLVRLMDEHRLEVLTMPGEQAHALQAEVCHAFVELSRQANAEITLEGHRVGWQTLLDNRRDGIEKFHDLDGKPVETTLFERFFVQNRVEGEGGEQGLKGGKPSPGTPAATAPTTPKPQAEPSAGPEPQKPKIYFSYAWGDEREEGESREKIVNALYDSLKNDGYDVRRDKMDLEYGALISDFMREIGQGDLIVVCVSDKYLRSVYCMWELCEIHRNALGEKEKFVDKIIPVRVEDLGLDKPRKRGEYLDFWQEYYNEWDEYFQKYRNLMNGPDWEAFQKARTVLQKFSEVTGYFQDMNAKTKALLSENDFAEVKKRIVAKTQARP
jgi:hypothetical protein